MLGDGVNGVIFLKGICRPLLAALCGSLALLIPHVGVASAAQFPQCPAVGSDTGCAQVIVASSDGTANVLVDPSQGPYDGSDDTLVGMQNNSGKPISRLNLGSPTGQRIFAFDGDGLCSPTTWVTRNPTTPPGCPNPVLGIGFGFTGYEGPGISFSNISPNQMTGTVNFNPAIRAGGSAYFALEGALTAGQLRSTQDGPIPGPATVSGSTVQFQLTCVGAPSCAGKARLVVKQQGKRISANLLQGKGHLVVVGSVPVSIGGGQTITAAIKPNNTGKRLLKAHRNGFKTTIRVVIANTTYTVGAVKLP